MGHVSSERRSHLLRNFAAMRYVPSELVSYVALARMSALVFMILCAVISSPARAFSEHWIIFFGQFSAEPLSSAMMLEAVTKFRPACPVEVHVVGHIDAQEAQRAIGL